MQNLSNYIELYVKEKRVMPIIEHERDKQSSSADRHTAKCSPGIRTGAPTHKCAVQTDSGGGPRP